MITLFFINYFLLVLGVFFSKGEITCLNNICFHIQIYGFCFSFPELNLRIQLLNCYQGGKGNFSFLKEIKNVVNRDGSVWSELFTTE